MQDKTVVQSPAETAVAEAIQPFVTAGTIRDLNNRYPGKPKVLVCLNGHGDFTADLARYYCTYDEQTFECPICDAPLGLQFREEERGTPLAMRSPSRGKFATTGREVYRDPTPTTSDCEADAPKPSLLDAHTLAMEAAGHLTAICNTTCGTPTHITNLNTAAQWLTANAESVNTLTN